ncbi:MAG: hypothetical protein AAFR14_13630, partial [Bacteroidota bacterium]
YTADNDLPQRMYGVIPIMVEDPKSHISPVVKMSEVLKPNEPFEVIVSERDGQDMYYTIAVVDEGLLDLTNFDTPNPHDYFYSKRSLGVKTWDMFDDVSYGKLVNAGRIVSVGGDRGEDETTDRSKSAVRFEPVVFSAGPFRLEGKQKAKHSFLMPNYV